MNLQHQLFRCVLTAAGLASLFCGTAAAEEVRWFGPAGSRIKAVRGLDSDFQLQQVMPAGEPLDEPADHVIHSPPIDGFVPWMVLIATGQRKEPLEFEAVVEPTVRGSFPSGVNPQHDFMIGIFDTGASAHVLGYQNAVTAGLYNNTYLTTNFTPISGVTGSVDVWVSQPLGLFMQGLDVLDPNSPIDPEAVLPTTAGMKGQSNVSVLIGDYPGDYPDIHTAIGSPMSAYYTTHIETAEPVTVLRHGTSYTAPRLTFYDKGDPDAPSYPNKLPLELKPLGAVNVQYMPELDLFGGTFDFEPATPSVIMGNLSQSLFFVHSVDIRVGDNEAKDKDRFMLDTGAQVTVIGTRIAARLGLNPTDKAFEVEIEGVTGETMMAPGFYLDSLKMPAIGQWLEYTNVPVILLDIASAEGGTLDGIIGMNLFTEYNLILRGGGFFLEDDPVLEFQRIDSPLTADIAPPGGDGVVDYHDFAVFSEAWLTDDTHPDWNPQADFVPNGHINIADLVILADQWLIGARP